MCRSMLMDVAGAMWVTAIAAAGWAIITAPQQVEIV